MTGAGALSHYSITSVAAGSQFRNTTAYGFSMITADNNTLSHHFISLNGTVLDTNTILASGAAMLAVVSGLLAGRRRR